MPKTTHRCENVGMTIETPRFTVTDDVLATSAHWALRRQGRVLGVYGFSDLRGWWSAVAHEDGWETLPWSGEADEARRRVTAICGRGRWSLVGPAGDAW